VAGASDLDSGLDRPTTVRAQTFDGWKYELRIGKAVPEDRYYAKASVSGSVAEKREPRAGEKSGEKDKEDKAFAERQAAMKAKLEHEQSLGAFTVLLPKSTAEPLLRDRGALLIAEKRDGKKDGKKK
jgi:hypothetical protein